MAPATGAITEDSDLAPIMTANDISRLTPQGGSFEAWHIKAWTDTLSHYANQPDPLLESDLDTDKLTPVVIHNVAMQAFAYGRDKDMANYHRREYLRQLNLVDPRSDQTDASSGRVPWGGTIETEMG